MKKILNYKTLMTILAVIVVILQIIISVFKININIDVAISVCIALISAMVTIGIVKKNKEDKTIESKEDLKELLDFDNIDKKEENNLKDNEYDDNSASK